MHSTDCKCTPNSCCKDLIDISIFEEKNNVDIIFIITGDSNCFIGIRCVSILIYYEIFTNNQ